MKNLRLLFYALVFIMESVLVSCSPDKKGEQNESVAHEHMEGEEQHDEGEEAHKQGAEAGEDHSGHDESSMTENGTKTWSPTDDGTGSILSDFHFIAGAIENVSPEVIKNDAGENVLKVTGDGTASAFVFHQSYDNIGMAVDLNAVDFKGTIKLIHHAQNASNYEFVAVNAGKMKLGRVMDGSEKIFDEAVFDNTTGWLNLRVSAAGSHYKGSIGSKNITHGHGDKMKAGYVGIMIEGTGIVLIKSIELVQLEDE